MNTKNWSRYTKKQLEFISTAYLSMPVRDITPAFNKKFRLDKTDGQIRAVTRNHKILSGRTGCFEQGQKPWNLGKKGYMGANITSFKKGSTPPNTRPLGSERICKKDGFILVKISEPNPYTGASTRYKHKHVHIWETANGPVPKNHVVFFKDGNKLNCDLDNLILLRRAELLAVNSHRYKALPEELKPSVLALAKLEAKAGFRIHPPRGRKKAADRIMAI